MAKLSTHGDFPVDLIESAKAELAGELNFSEEQEPSKRSGAGYPSLGNVLGHGFDFGEPPVSNFYDEDLRRLRDQLKIVSNNIGRGNDYGSKTRAAELRREIRDKLAQHKRNVAAAQAAVGDPEPEGSSMEVETDNRGALIPDYKETQMKNSAFQDFSEEALEALDFARCQRPDGSFYGTGGQCRKGSPTGAKEKEAPKGRSSKGASKPAASSGGAPSSKEVRALDKVAKAADKKAEAADKKWRKGGMKDKALQKEVRSLDREAKAANRAAEKADKAFQKGAKAKSKPAADPDKAAKSEERAAKQLKSAKGRLRMEANNLKEMRDAGITDSRISAAAARVRNEKAKVEKLRNAAAKKSGKARPEKSTMTSRIAKEERDIRRKAGAGNAKSKQYVDLKKRIQEGKVEDPISARRQLSSLRAELKPASPNQ